MSGTAYAVPRYQVGVESSWAGFRVGLYMGYMLHDFGLQRALFILNQMDSDKGPLIAQIHKKRASEHDPADTD